MVGVVDELTVGDLSARSGVAVSALHFYEKKGLITSRRTSGNQRRYRRDTLRRVALIRIGQRVGIPLAEIAAVLATLPDGRTPNRHDWQELSRPLAGAARRADPRSRSTCATTSATASAAAACRWTAATWRTRRTRWAARPGAAPAAPATR